MPRLPPKMIILSILAKVSLKNRNWTFSIVCYFTWKLEVISNILSVVVESQIILVHMVRKVAHWITLQLQTYLDVRMLSNPRYKWLYLVFWRQRGEIPPSPCLPPCPRLLALYLQQTKAKNTLKQSSVYRFPNPEIRVNFWWALWTIFKSEVATKSIRT